MFKIGDKVKFKGGVSSFDLYRNNKGLISAYGIGPFTIKHVYPKYGSFFVDLIETNQRSFFIERFELASRIRLRKKYV